MKYTASKSIKEKASECTKLPIAIKSQNYYSYQNKIQQAIFEIQLNLCDRVTNIPLNINADFFDISDGGLFKENKIKSISAMGVNDAIYQYVTLESSSRAYRNYGEPDES